MAAKTNFRGSFTALVTPFKNGSLDEAAFRALVSWQIAEGTHGLVPVGTTGESPTVSHDEHKRVVEWCIDEAKGRVPVVAGAGSNSTREAIELAQHPEKAPERESPSSGGRNERRAKGPAISPEDRAGYSQRNDRAAMARHTTSQPVRTATSTPSGATWVPLTMTCRRASPR